MVRFNGSIDSSTGSIGLVFQIDNPYRPDPTIKRPPISNGSFVKVILSSSKPIEAIRIPRSAVHLAEDGTSYVYLMNAKNKLARRSVKLGPAQNEMIVVNDGLSQGEKLVLSDPLPTVIGAPLEPVKQ